MLADVVTIIGTQDIVFGEVDVKTEKRELNPHPLA